MLVASVAASVNVTAALAVVEAPAAITIEVLAGGIVSDAELPPPAGDDCCCCCSPPEPLAGAT